MRHVLVFSLLTLAGCSAPTFSQRQQNWERYRDMTRATCVIGKTDPAMPPGVRFWCERAVEP